MTIGSDRWYRLVAGLLGGLGVFLIIMSGAPVIVVLLLFPVIVIGAALLSIAIEVLLEGR